MNISAIENVYNEQDTLFGDGLDISKIKQGGNGWNTGGPVVGKSNLNQSNLLPKQTIIQKYKHKGLNSLYYVMPKS